MARRPKVTLKRGTVVLIPIDADRSGVAQVAALHGRHNQYFAVYDAIVRSGAPIELEQALTAPLLFLALSFDALVHNGDWPVVGEMPVPDHIAMPAYKEEIGVPGNVHVVDHTGTRRRPATAAEAELLPYRSFVAPVRIEKAVQAKHGIGEWIEEYSKLAPPENATTARMFP